MPGPKDSGFGFQRVWLRELTFRDHREASPPSAREVGLSVQVKIRLADDKRSALVTVTMSVKPDASEDFEELAATLEAQFVATDDEHRDKLHEFVTRQGVALLVPYLREVITNVTARSRGGPLLLPPLNLYNLDIKTDAPARQG